MSSPSSRTIEPAESPVPAAPRSDFRPLILFSLGHFFVDLYSSALGAFQPVLVERFGLSLAQAGILGGILVTSSSVTQPAYGYLSDRFHSKLFSALAPAVAGIFISCLGIAPGFGWLMTMVALGGAGIASFHPQASARAALGLTGNRSRWFAVFVSAGTLGFSLGPLLFSTLISRKGLEWTWTGAVPGVLASLMLLTVLPEGPPEPSSAPHRFDWPALRACWRPLTILYLLVFIRSIVQVSFAQFLPLYLHRERGFSYPAAAQTLALYLAAGAIGGFVGGHLADRTGGRRVILISMLGCLPFLALFFLADGVWAVCGLALGGLMLLFTIPVNVVMGQQLVPSQAGTVSALMMGFAWGLAGLIFIPLTGWLADVFSLGAVLAALSVFPLVGWALALKLPKNL